MTAPDLAVMLTIALGVGLLLALEHLACRTARIAQQIRYAMGVVTLLVGLVGWALYARLPWPVIVGLIVVAVMPGVPVFILFYQRDLERARNEITAARSAAQRLQLVNALLRTDPQTRRSLKRLGDLSDDLRWAAGILDHQTQLATNDCTVFLRQIQDILSILENVKDK